MRILVGVDGSGPSSAALAWALSRAAESTAPVVLVHVADDEADYAGAAGSAGVGATSGVLEAAVTSAVASHPALEISSALLRGNPGRELAAAAHPEDLLVIGTHKTGYLHGRTMGTRGIVVASIASCTVVVVPEPTVARRRGVVVGVGASPWRSAVAAAAKEAERTGQQLTLVHASPALDTTRQPDPARILLADAATHATRTAPGVEVRTLVSRRRATDALLDASRTAALLVLGGGGSHSDLLSPVIHDVLLNINAPVEIARSVIETEPLHV